MRNDTKIWMDGAAERSIRAFLMTAENLTKDNEALDADDTEALHWAWEGVHHIAAARLAHAQLEAHEAAHAPASPEELRRLVQDVRDKMDALTGNGNAAAPAKA